MVRKAITATAMRGLAATDQREAGMKDQRDARESDPVTRGVMQGFPPPADKLVGTAGEISGASFPNTRWAFSHQRELKATANIRRGPNAPYVFPRKLRDDLDAVAFTSQEGVKLTWQQSLDEMFTDGIVVLHRGAIVYETYRGALQAPLPHIAFSITKSFTGTLAAVLAHEGKIDPEAPTTRYVPELAGSAFGDATVRQVMDMI